MSDLTISGNVVPGTNAEFLDVIAGGVVNVGQACYRDLSTGKYLPGLKGNAAQALCVGISVNSAANIDEPLRLQTAGDMAIGATVVAGTVYIAGAAAGGIAPAADGTTGNYVTVLALAISTTTFRVGVILHNGLPHA